MIRHVVMFQFLPEAEGRTKGDNVALTMHRLNALPPLMDWIRSFTVAVNAPDASGNNHDLILIADFDSMEDLERYQFHPAHVAVGDFMRPLRSSRACVDFLL